MLTVHSINQRKQDKSQVLWGLDCAEDTTVNQCISLAASPQGPSDTEEIISLVN